MKAAFAFAVWLFAQLHANDPEASCEVWGVWSEPNLAHHWWACGACQTSKRRENGERPYLASALIKCEGEDCSWVNPWPANVDAGLCEQVDVNEP